MAFLEYDGLEPAYFSSKEMGKYVDPEPRRPLVQLIKKVTEWVHEAIDLAGTGHNPFSKS